MISGALQFSEGDYENYMKAAIASRQSYKGYVQIGDRIHKLMERDGLMGDKSDMHGRIDLNKRQLKLHDELEDFFDEGNE